MRRLGVIFALALFLLGTLASEFALAGGGGRGGGSHGAGGHRGGGGKHFHHGHGGKHFHPGHGRVGVFIGAPVVFGGWPYAWPYYYPSPGYYPSAPYYPPAYIERGNGQQPVPQQEQPAPAYWYYCPDAKAYYPYVTECRGGWQQVAPQPPPPS